MVKKRSPDISFGKDELSPTRIERHHLGDTNDSSLSHDLHKGLYFDYIMANPPFNLKGWYDENLKADARWSDYGIPS